MLKKIILIIALFSFSFSFAQKNSVKGLGYSSFPPFELPEFYYYSVAYERMIFQEVSLQLTYGYFYWDSEGDYNKSRKICPEFRYYFYNYKERFNFYGMLFDEYLTCHEHYWYEDFSAGGLSSHTVNNYYYINGIGLGCGVKVNISKRFFFDVNISARHYFHLNSEYALDGYYSNTPSLFRKIGIRTSAFFGFNLF